MTFGSPRFSSLEVGGLLVTDAFFPPNVSLPPHTHDRTTVATTLKGSFDSSLCGRSHLSRTSYVLTEPAGERHSNYFERAGARIVIVQPDMQRESLLRPCATLLQTVNHFQHGGVSALAARLSAELQQRDEVSALAIEGLALEMLATAARASVRFAERRPPRWLALAVELLHARFNERLTIGEIAAEAGVHPMHLTRVFRQYHLVSIGGYVRRLRLEWAAQRLSRSNDPIVEIAVNAGFTDQSHFTRTFHRHMGFTPREYRKTVNS